VLLLLAGEVTEASKINAIRLTRPNKRVFLVDAVIFTLKGVSMWTWLVPCCAEPWTNTGLYLCTQMNQKKKL